MKRIALLGISLITFNAFTALLAEPLRPPVRPAVPPAPTSPGQPVPPPPLAAASEDITPAQQLQAAQRNAEAAVGDALKIREKQQHAYADANVDYMNRLGNFNSVLKNITQGSMAQPGRSLVVRSSDTDSKSLGAAQEDLNVMSRIFDKALAKAGDEEERKAMGITLTSFGSGVKNIQIEGYGAIFLLNVNFPLSGPETRQAEEKPKEPTNSAWDETRDELYGSHEARGPHRPAPAVEFDPKRVDELKDALLDASKYASNIRSLKDNESVTVVVNSNEDQGPFRFKRVVRTNTSGSAGDSGGGGSGGGSGGGGKAPVVPADGTLIAWSSSDSSAKGRQSSTLTIRVKKQDIDAFFKGKLSLEEFHRKAIVALY